MNQGGLGLNWGKCENSEGICLEFRCMAKLRLTAGEKGEGGVKSG